MWHPSLGKLSCSCPPTGGLTLPPLRRTIGGYNRPFKGAVPAPSGFQNLNGILEHRDGAIAWLNVIFKNLFRAGCERFGIGRGPFRLPHPVSGQIAERRFAECHFAECVSPNVILPMCFLPTCKKVEMLNVEMRFADMPFWRSAKSRNVSLPKCQFAECDLPKSRLVEM